MTLLSDQVRLTEFELRWLGWIGERRWQSAVQNARDPGLGPSSDDPTPNNHMRGARTEFAASLILNLYWRPYVDNINGHLDVGGVIETRSTVLPDGRLIVKPEDIAKKPDVPFVLVVEASDHYRLAGWLFARQAEVYPLLTCFGDPAHFIPQNCLWSIESLRSWIKDARP